MHAVLRATASAVMLHLTITIKLATLLPLPRQHHCGTERCPLLVVSFFTSSFSSCLLNSKTEANIKEENNQNVYASFAVFSSSFLLQLATLQSVFYMILIVFHFQKSNMLFCSVLCIYSFGLLTLLMT